MASFKQLLKDLSPVPSTSGSTARAFRKALDLTMKDVEKISGIKESNLSALENDRKDMTKKTAEVLAAVYGVQAWLILFPNGEDVKDEKLLKLAKKAEKFMAARTRAARPVKAKRRA